MLNPGLSLTTTLQLERRLPWRLATRLAEHNDRALREKYRVWVEQTPPAPVAAAGAPAEVHQLLGHRHVGMGLWSLKSLVRATDGELGVVVHDDGSLDATDQDLFRRHLPGVRIIPRAQADQQVRALLATYPACTSFRFGEVMVANHRGQRYNMFIMALILFDMPLLAQADKVIILDADVLFFRRPALLVDWAADPSDARALYSVEGYRTSRAADGSLSFGPKVARTLNSGLLCYSRQALYDLAAIEAWVGANPDLMYTSPVFEQLCYSALVKARADSVELDPASYGFNYTTPESIATHFGIKRGFYDNLHRVLPLLTAAAPADRGP